MYTERFQGMVLGLALGDSLGLPREGLAPARAAARFGQPLRHALIGSRGLLSDDTEHAWMTAQALLASDLVPARFQRSLAWRLRGWLVALPPGIGFGTLRACARLWIGVAPGRSGVASAGNGPLMRAPVIGATVRDPALRTELVDISTAMTHRHVLPREAARAVADLAAAAIAGERRPHALLDLARGRLRDPRWQAPLARVADGLTQRSTAEAWAAREGLSAGVTGYVLHTIPAVLMAWLRDPGDATGTLTYAIELGGDTDTTAAIAGALAGACAGQVALPAPLVDGIADWPLSKSQLRAIATQLAVRHQGVHASPPLHRWRWLAPLRNLAMVAVLTPHLVRRLIDAAWRPECHVRRRSR
jgi:ADP-ribosyl-[dinitrogen reductase] hydrolase